jgi:hypothetical protein
MPKFKYFFEKPSIISCKPENDVVCHNSVTNITIETLGWGWLRIKTKTEPKWPGIKKFISAPDQRLTASAPQGTELQITMINCFGIAKLMIRPIKPNSELHEIIAPQYPIFNKNLLNVIKPPNYSSFNKMQFSLHNVKHAFKNAKIKNHVLPKNKLQATIQQSKQALICPKNRTVLSKANLINTRINLFKPPINFQGVTHNLRLSPIKISNKIDTTFIQND